MRSGPRNEPPRPRSARRLNPRSAHF